MGHVWKFAGIDVGGKKKGFHLVGLSEYGSLQSRHVLTPEDAALAVKSWGVHVVAVDAPMSWAAVGRSRVSEQKLEFFGIHCFKTPCESVARDRPFYDWVRNGLALYDVLGQHEYRRPKELPKADKGSLRMIETFPHAVARRLSVSESTGRSKVRFRRQVLREYGIDESQLRNIDFVDAALCALLARIYLEQGESATESPGDIEEGMFIPIRKVNVGGS